MDYLKAVRGPMTHSAKVKLIQSAADTELRRKLSDEELSTLASKFSLDTVFNNIEKVNFI